LPNIRYRYFCDVEDVFEQYGSALQSGTVVFVGGAFYAHAYKSRYPDATVVAIEENPLSAYTQQLAAYYLSKGVTPAAIKQLLFFDYAATGDPGTIAEETLERRRYKHQQFVNSSWSHFDSEFLTEVFNHVPEIEPRTRTETPVAGSLLDVASTDEWHVCLNPWIEQEAAHTQLLYEVGQTAPVDAVRIADVSTVSLDANVVFLNTVCDYLDPGTLSVSIDALSADTGAFVEAVLLYDRHTPETLDACVPEEITSIDASYSVGFWISGTGDQSPSEEGQAERIRLYRPTSSA
jgi:hypothetical protein